METWVPGGQIEMGVLLAQASDCLDALASEGEQRYLHWLFSPPPLVHFNILSQTRAARLRSSELY